MDSCAIGSLTGFMDCFIPETCQAIEERYSNATSGKATMAGEGLEAHVLKDYNGELCTLQ